MKKEKLAYMRFVKQVHSLQICSGSDEQHEATIIATLQRYHCRCFSFLQKGEHCMSRCSLCGMRMIVLPNYVTLLRLCYGLWTIRLHTVRLRASFRIWLATDSQRCFTKSTNRPHKPSYSILLFSSLSQTALGTDWLK